MKPPPLTARVPDLVETRGARTLLVWAEPGTWLVADDELHQLVTALDGRRSTGRVCKELARRWSRPRKQVGQEVEGALTTLRRLGVVGPIATDEDTWTIANVTLNITNRCNLRCTHCYNDPGGNEASAEELARALRAAIPVLDPAASLIILGGEPLLDLDRLETLLDGVDGVFPAPPMVSSNGTRIDKNAARRLARLNLDLQVSLDGPNPGANDAVRGAGAFVRAVNGIRRLRGQGLPVTLNMVYDRDNLDTMEAYGDLALELGVTEMRFIPLRLIGRAVETPAKAPDQRLALDHVLALLERRPELRPLLKRDFFTITREVCRRGGARGHCGIGRRVVFVDADGSVYPCPNHRLPAFNCGNAMETPLPALFGDSAVMKAVRQDYRVGRYEGCGDCPVRTWCAGDCRGEVLALTGRANGPAPHCQEMKRLVPALMWLIADGDPRLDAPSQAPAFC